MRNRLTGMFLAFLCMALLLAHAALAQVDLSGEWGEKGPKDAPDAPRYSARGTRKKSSMLLVI